MLNVLSGYKSSRVLILHHKIYTQKSLHNAQLYFNTGGGYTQSNISSLFEVVRSYLKMSRSQFLIMVMWLARVVSPMDLLTWSHQGVVNSLITLKNTSVDLPDLKWEWEKNLLGVGHINWSCRGAWLVRWEFFRTCFGVYAIAPEATAWRL